MKMRSFIVNIGTKIAATLGCHDWNWDKKPLQPKIAAHSNILDYVVLLYLTVLMCIKITTLHVHMTWISHICWNCAAQQIHWCIVNNSISAYSQLYTSSWPSLNIISVMYWFDALNLIPTKFHSWRNCWQDPVPYLPYGRHTCSMNDHTGQDMGLQWMANIMACHHHEHWQESLQVI